MGARLSRHQPAGADPHICHPQGGLCQLGRFQREGSEAEIAGFIRAVGHVAREQGLVAPGYRLLANAGIHSHQEVPHFHVHLFGGKALGPMLMR
jgi:histidine triad (HIT) family protein